MILLSCRGIKKEFGTLTVLADIDLDIQAGQRIGLVGANGAGKTTLAHILFGKITADEGVIQCHSQTRIGYLRQSTSYTMQTFNGLLGDASQGDQLELEHLLEVTSHLGLKQVHEWSSERLSGLSGGEQTKLALAHIWATKPDILILDEPTNHLDLHGVEWLVQELNGYDGAALIISHDRYFLDQVAHEIVEIEDGRAYHYAGNYTFYREEKARQYESQRHQYEVQQKQQQKIETEIARLENWSAKAHRDSTKTSEMRMGVKEYHRKKAKKMDKQVKSRINRLKKIEIEGVKQPREEQKVDFTFSDADKRGRRIVEAKQLVKSYGARSLFRASSFYIQRGDKIGLLGENGCGKTTLLRIMMGEEMEDRGEIWVSPTAQIAYLSQDVTDLAGEQTSLEMIQKEVDLRSDYSKARTLLAHMGFDETMLDKPIKQLSLGERTRIKIAYLILRKHDFLILDEPTSHLDLHSREQLEKTLSEYKGTLLIVSHDTYLLEKICDKLLIIEDSVIRKVESGLKEYHEKKVKQHMRNKQMASIRMSEEDSENRMMVIEHRMVIILGKLGQMSPGDPAYVELDEEFKALVSEKRQLMP